jgi:hypothetical protein
MGKSIPLELIEVRNPCSSEQFEKIARVYHEAFALYRAGKFHQAEKLFRPISSIDKPSVVLANRCAEFEKDPPQNWQGIFTIIGK